MGAPTENGDMPIPGHAMVMSVDFKDAGMRFHGNPLRMLQENASNNGLTLYCKSLGYKYHHCYRLWLGSQWEPSHYL